MRVMVSSHVLLMLVVQAWPNCVIHFFVSWFLSAGGGGCVCVGMVLAVLWDVRPVGYTCCLSVKSLCGC